jgi:hypothetical protein
VEIKASAGFDPNDWRAEAAKEGTMNRAPTNSWRRIACHLAAILRCAQDDNSREGGAGQEDAVREF